MKKKCLQNRRKKIDLHNSLKNFWEGGILSESVLWQQTKRIFKDSLFFF